LKFSGKVNFLNLDFSITNIVEARKTGPLPAPFRGIPASEKCDFDKAEGLNRYEPDVSSPKVKTAEGT
jgi:hypothetical protein